MTSPKYPSYKPGHSKNIRLLPEHWAELPLKRLFRLEKREPLESDEIVTAFRDGTVTLRKNRREDGFTNALKEIGYQRIHREDLVIHAMDAFAGAIGVSDSEGKSSPVYSACTATKEANPYFYAYYLRDLALHGFIESLAKGIRERSTDFRWSDASMVAVPVPPRSEQLAIATFLDRETTKIDALIAEQQRLIELLQEKRQAVISHAVTKGLNPNVPMKDSGVEWLGEVPEHWNVSPMKRVLVKIEQGWSPECHASPAEENEWGIVKAGCVNGGIFNPLSNKTLPSHLQPPLEYEIQVGDLLMCRASGSPDLIGSAAYIEEVRPRLLLSDKIFRLRTAEGLDSRYLADLLSSTPLRQQIRQSISGAVGLANNLPQSEIKDFILPLPPAKEQEEIHDFLAKETTKLRTLLNESESLIGLLQERRSSLISAAVTGRIDVRGLAEAGADER
jgi:type I restriction enzyme, S subunit